MLLVPSIDLRGGRCVRLFQGNFDAETRYDLEPHELLLRYRTMGATWLHVVDLDGAKDGVLANRSIILRLASQRALNLQVGGGVRSLGVIDDLLRSGVDRVVIGSAAVESPDEVVGWLRRFGAEKIAIAADVRRNESGEPIVVSRGWTASSGQSLWALLDFYVAAGLKHLLCTDVERDGAMSGPAVDLYEEGLRRHPAIAWQASGGVRDAADLRTLANIGVSAAVSGKALLEERMRPEEMRPFLPNA